MAPWVLKVAGLCLALPLAVGHAGANDDRMPVAEVLDSLHAAAAHGDAELYFSLFLEDAIFLGTDGGERWTMDEFRTFATPYFEDGEAWTYVPIERHVVVSDDGRIAWFDELLHNDKYGLTRGSGVLVETGLGWEIAQYHLTFPIPNEIAPEITSQLQSWRKSHARSDLEGAPEGNE